MVRFCGIMTMLLLVVGCSSHRQVSQVADVSPKEWYSPVGVSFEVGDLLGRCDMQIMLRYGEMISADSVELLVTTIAPDGVAWSEPFMIYTPATKQVITIVDSDYRHNISWRQEGKYRVSFQPQHNYQGVTAVGVNLIYKDEQKSSYNE